LIHLNQRRGQPRFSFNVPVTIFIGGRTFAGYTKNVSDKGIYFYLGLEDSEIVDGDFEFVLEVPPEITLSIWCPIRCKGRLIRKEKAAKDLVGIAAKILQYSILREPHGNGLKFS
jgi:PilZ domain